KEKSNAVNEKLVALGRARDGKQPLHRRCADERTEYRTRASDDDGRERLQGWIDAAIFRNQDPGEIGQKNSTHRRECAASRENVGFDPNHVDAENLGRELVVAYDLER